MPGFNQCLLKCLPCSLLLDISKPAGPGRRKRSYRVGWVQVDERKKGNGLLGSGDTDTKVSEQGGQRPGVQVTCPGPSRAGAWGTAPAAQAGWALGRFPGESPAQREGVSLRAGRQGARLPPRTHAPARPRLCQGSRGQEGCPIWGATLNPLFSLHLPVTPPALCIELSSPFLRAGGQTKGKQTPVLLADLWEGAGVTVSYSTKGHLWLRKPCLGDQGHLKPVSRGRKSQPGKGGPRPRPHLRPSF